eukprot:2077328-Amphidinium_carterae.1
MRMRQNCDYEDGLKVHDEVAERLARAQELLQEGLLHKACCALEPGQAIHEIDTAVVKEMEQTHLAPRVHGSAVHSFDAEG